MQQDKPSPPPSSYPPPYEKQPQPQPPPMNTTQPIATPGMDLRNVNGVPRQPNGEREWSFGLCDFFGDCGTCCLGLFVPCIVYSQIKTRLEYLESTGHAHPYGGDPFSSGCLVHGTLDCCGLGWLLQIGQRGFIRDRYGISGNGCTDCLTAYCCSPCELTQESRELRLEEKVLTGGARASGMGYP